MLFQVQNICCRGWDFSRVSYTTILRWLISETFQVSIQMTRLSSLIWNVWSSTSWQTASASLKVTKLLIRELKQTKRRYPSSSPWWVLKCTPPSEICAALPHRKISHSQSCVHYCEITTAKRQFK